MQDYTADNIKNEISSGIRRSDKSPLIVVFTANWISSSSIVKVVVNKIKAQAAQASVLEIDTDMNKDLVTKYRIHKLPTCLIFQDQELTHKLEGTFSKKDVLQYL